MPYFPFNTNVPNAPNDAADDQPDMKINNISLDRLIAVDHHTFNGNPVNNPGGYHKKMTLLNTDTPTDVPISGETVYLLAKSKNSNSWPAFFNSTRDTGNAAITIMTGRSKLKENGYQYLPGGLLIQWGVTKQISTSNPFFGDSFPIPFFQTPYVVNVQVISNSLNANSRLTLNVTSKNKTGFKANTSFSNFAFKRVMWTAIGLANA